MNEPKKIFAGDQYKFTETFPDYPASNSWIAKYYITGAVVANVSGVPNGSSFDFTLDSTFTTALTLGTYKSFIRVTKGAESHTISHTLVEVEINPANISAPYEARSTWHIAYDNLKTIIKNKSTEGYENLQVAMPSGVSRTITKLSWDEIFTAYHHAERMIQLEDNQDRIDSGVGGKKILLKPDLVT